MHDNLQRLAQINAHPHPVTTLYLALDQPREARMQALGQMIKRKEQQLSQNGSAGKWDLVAGDMEQIARFVEELPLGPDRGLALFSCRSAGLFEHHPLSLTVPNLLEVGPAPYIRPLAALASDHRPILVVLLDQRRVRFFQGIMGMLEEMPELAMDNPPTQTQRDGDQGRAGDSRLARRSDQARERHFKLTANLVMDQFKQGGFQELVLGGSKPAVESFQRQLHPYLAQRLLGVFTCEVGASLAQVMEEVAVLQPQARRRRQEKLLAGLAESLGPGGKAVTGLNQVLAALHEGQVHTLFVERDYTAAGGVCPQCARLRHVAGECPLCGEMMTAVDDVVNLALAQALEHGALLEQVEGPSLLQDYGHIAALLRYV